MGWFDDHHPMGQAAEDDIMEALDAIGGKWQKDPPKASSSSSSRNVKRIERPGAEWGIYFY